jgi:hypothetical protein
MIRPLRLRDLGLLNAYRHRGLFLDSVPTLSWGREIVPLGAVLSTVSSLSGVFTSLSVNEGKEPTLLGQVVHNAGSAFAHFSFLAPNDALDSAALPELLEHLISQVGSRGAHSLTAELEESDPAFTALRQAGFALYAHQRVWQLDTVSAVNGASFNWRAAQASDKLAINLLGSSIVPGLVQQVEPAAWDEDSGYVLYQDAELSAYVSVRSGPRGICLQPFVHPDAANMEDEFLALSNSLRPNIRRPIYLAVRSYQNWLEPVMQSIGAQAGPTQTLLVKRTTRRVKMKETQAIIAATKRSTEPTMPIKMPTTFTIHDEEIVAYDQAPNYR